MKLLITILFIVLSINAFGQEGWSNQTPPSPYPGLLGVYALDSDSIWAVGEEGTIIHSNDGGVTWDSIPSGITESLFTVEFINSDTGWVAGDDDRSASTLLRTTDGGLSWEAQSLSGGGAIPIYDLDFIEGLTGAPIRGFITGGLGYTWRTENFGSTWESVRNQCENTFYSSYFVNNDSGWFVGTPSVQEPYTIMRTMDGGNTWQEQTNPTGQNLRGVCFGTDLRGLAVGLVGTILYTTDGGANWEARPNNGYRWESVFLTESGKAWAVGSDGNIAYSTDWGYSWESQESGVSVELWEVYFINDEEGWIVGGGIGQPGVILHTTNGGVITDVNERNNDIVKKYELLQNYPNPFNPTTTIEFSLPKSEYVELRIYNILGNEVATLVSHKLNQSNHTYQFDGKNLASGIYYYQLVAGDYREVKKMILLK